MHVQLSWLYEILQVKDPAREPGFSYPGPCSMCSILLDFSLEQSKTAVS